MHNTQACMFCRYRRTAAGASAAAPCCTDRPEQHRANDTVAPAALPPRERPRHGAFVAQRH